MHWLERRRSSAFARLPAKASPGWVTRQLYRPWLLPDQRSDRPPYLAETPGLGADGPPALLVVLTGSNGAGAHVVAPWGAFRPLPHTLRAKFDTYPR